MLPSRAGGAFLQVQHTHGGLQTATTEPAIYSIEMFKQVRVKLAPKVSNGNRPVMKTSVWYFRKSGLGNAASDRVEVNLPFV